MKTQEEVTFHCLTESNEWEGEIWYHYFLDEPEVFRILEQLMFEEDDNDYTDLETMTVTWPEAERLTNLDVGDYMQKFWFGRLTNLEGLRQADSEALYKGKIRNFGEELFSYDEPESEDENPSAPMPKDAFDDGFPQFFESDKGDDQ